MIIYKLSVNDRKQAGEPQSRATKNELLCKLILFLDWGTPIQGIKNELH
jgi:hypothetical protein